MTAEKNTDSSSDNSGEQPEDSTATTANTEPVLRYLRERSAPASREELLAHLRYPEATLDRVLEALEERDVVTIEHGAARDLVRLEADNADRAECPDCQSGPPTPGTIELSPAVVFDVLGSMRRRSVIRLLASEDLLPDPRGVTVTSLATSLAAAERDIGRRDVTVEQTIGRGADLHRRHLPVLAEFDIVEWDEEADRVRPTQTVAKLAALIDVVEDACTREV